MRGIVTDVHTVTYHPQILDELERHGLQPSASTPPDFLRDAVRDLYKYEIRKLRADLLAGHFRKSEYAGHIIELRKRYWVLSVPLHLWLQRLEAPLP